MSEIEQISIGRFSLLTKLSPKALRIYDKKGLLIPAIKDDLTGYRYYKISQIKKGIKIKMLTNLGFKIDKIKEILSNLEVKA
ncbi:MAG: MerR family transcriptional regulator [Promethearchaeota archaeon]